ncbi:uncharacterized protein LOC135820217 [Sycon ciliatum]|uniref:uncharacterized protein LOC135820217 n=1 Tax=Sycon ciliatum TaxID=27933 RepID=UPI0031F633B6
MSRAFHTVRRDVLLEVLHSFLDACDLRIVQMLLTNTWLESRVRGAPLEKFSTNIGVPEGDSLSTVLFIFYLEAALKELRQALPVRPLSDGGLPLNIGYADDVGFISHSEAYLRELETIAPTILGKWHLNINASKTEYAEVSRKPDRTDEVWRSVKKLALC